MNTNLGRFTVYRPLTYTFRIMQVLILILAQLGGAIYGVAPAQAAPDEEATIFDTRTWTDPSGSGLTITFTTPETYYSCTSTFDRIYTTGIPDNWRLDGRVRVLYMQPTSTGNMTSVLVPGGEYIIRQTGNLDLTLTYPPAWSWPDLLVLNNPLREIHIDLGITVRDEKGMIVNWVGGDQQGAPGTLGPGGQDWDVFCNPNGSIGDTVWLDDNGNGTQETGEAGIPGVTVNLKDAGPDSSCGTADDIFITSQVTDANGKYLFNRLPPDAYCVDPDQSTVPPGLVLTTNNDPKTVDLGPGQAYRDADFGYQPQQPSSICGYVYADTNNDGIRDPGEAPIPNAIIDLDWSTPVGALNMETTTDANGRYCFLNLSPGTYTVTETQPGGYLDGKDTQGTPGTGTTGNDVFSNITLPAGYNGDNNNFGELLAVRYTLGDRVWYDQDQDGIQDANEPGYPNGLTVSLYQGATCSGTAMMTTTSSASGLYQFTNLLAGTYSVGFAGLPAGWSVSPKDQGSNNALDSDATAAGCIENINLTANDPTQDMGIYVPGTLGDNVMCVSTGQPLANITVNLYKDFNADGQPDGGVFKTISTNASGFYQFTGLEVALAGDANNTTKYIVKVDTADLDLGNCNVSVPPTSYNPPLDSSKPNDPTNDFKFEVPKATVGDRVWYDNDNDGVQDAGEAGIPNVKVNLTNCSGTILASDVTDTNGIYLFEGLSAGTYCVVIDQTTLPAGVRQTFEKDGSLNGNTQQPLAAGNTVLDVDFGYRLLQPKVDIEKYVLVIPAATSTGGDMCATYGKPQILTMKYIGGAANVNAQDAGKVVVTGDPGTTSPVRIVVTNSTASRTYFDGQVSLNGTFTIDAKAAGQTALETNTYFKVYSTGGSLLQSVQFHTSCSQPIQLGDIYGSAQLVGYKDSTGAGGTLPEPPSGLGDDADTPPGPTAKLGDTIQWTYVVTNTGETNLQNGVVTDNILGLVCNIASLAPGASTSCKMTGKADKSGQYVNEGKVEAYSPQGTKVSDTDLAHYNVPAASCTVTAGTGSVKDKKFLWPMTNTGTQRVTLTELTVVWPQVNGQLLKVKFDGDVVWDTKANWTATGLTLTSANFTTDAKKKSIDPGRTRVFTLEFQNNAGADLSMYAVKATFDNGCVLVFVPGASTGGNFCATAPGSGRAKTLTMAFVDANGGDSTSYNCTANCNTQDPSKVIVSGDPAPATQVWIKAVPTGKTNVLFEGLVNLGSEFMMSALNAGLSTFDTNTTVTIYSNSTKTTLLSSVQFHTSCSQPLLDGDYYGSLELTGFTR